MKKGGRVWPGWALNTYEASWLACFFILAVVLAFFRKGDAFGVSVTISGLLCVLLAAKGHLHTYVFGIYNTISYSYIARSNGLFGEMGLNLFFFLPMNIAGFVMWRRHIERNVVEMRGLSLGTAAGIFVLCFVLSVALGQLLSMIEGQKTPYIDAATNVLSVVATFLMVLRYREQWLVYIFLNILTIFMWALRSMDGSLDGWMMLIMWFAYLVNAVYGCRVWYKGAASGRKTV